HPWRRDSPGKSSSRGAGQPRISRRFLGNPHRRVRRLLIGCRPGLPIQGSSDRGPDQDAGPDGTRRPNPRTRGSGPMAPRKAAVGAECLVRALILASLGGPLHLVLAIHRRVQSNGATSKADKLAAAAPPETKVAPTVEPPAPVKKPKPAPVPPAPVADP